MFGYRPAMKVENLLKSFKIFISDLFLKQWNILQICFLEKKNRHKRKTLLGSLHGGCLMDGWMDGRHPSDKCNATTTISDHIRCVVQIQTQAEEPLQPQVTLRWRLPPPVFTAATLRSPTPHLRSSRPPALARY
jgi:hypothetical protein